MKVGPCMSKLQTAKFGYILVTEHGATSELSLLESLPYKNEKKLEKNENSAKVDNAHDF